MTLDEIYTRMDMVDDISEIMDNYEHFTEAKFLRFAVAIMSISDLDDLQDEINMIINLYDFKYIINNKYEK